MPSKTQHRWRRPDFGDVLILVVILSCLFFSCSPDTQGKNSNETQDTARNEEQLYESYINASLTFKGDSLLRALHSFLPVTYSNRPRIVGYRAFLQSYKLFKERKPDSAKILLSSMLPKMGLDTAKDYELLILHRGMSVMLELIHGPNPETFTSLMPALRLAEKYPSRFRWWIYDMAAEAWYWSEDADKALSYALLGYKSIPDTNNYAVRGMFMDHIGRIKFSQKDLKSALKYEDSAYYLGEKAGDLKLIAAAMSAKADLLIRLGDTAKGYALQREAFEKNQRLNRQLMPSEYLNQAQTHFNKGYYDSAISYGKKASSIAARDKLLVKDAYGIVAESYRRIGQDDSAFHYLNESKEVYNKYKDELQLSKISALNEKHLQDKENAEKQVLVIRNQSQAVIVSQQRIIIVAAGACLILAICLFVIIMRRRKQRSESAGMALQQQLLRSQMDPHFTFSSLTNLNGLIREDRKDKAMKYLHHFARLMRVNLENSSQPFVSLHQEINAIESYLSLQAMRVGNTFDYHIDLYEGFDEDDDILVPPMLMQPFVENAIYHGIQNIGDRGQVKVVLSKTEGMLRCSIEDNGAGIQPKSSNGKPSMSTGITKERLRLLAKKTGKKADLQIIDKGREGTGTGVLVVIDIPYIVSAMHGR